MLRDAVIILCIIGLIALATWAVLYVLLQRRRERRRSRGRGDY